jgi:hypothetical protein
VSLDAQDWVWNHSQSKGTARLVLLAIADKAYGNGCSAYAGTTMLVQRSNAARSSVVAAVDKLIQLGELAVIDGQQGPRGETVYTLPKARHHRRSPSEGGPESGPVQNPDRSENRTGTESGPGGSENRTPGGPESGPHNAVGTQETQQPPAPASQAPTVAREITDEDKREFGRFWHNHPKSKDYDKTREAWVEAVLAGAEPVAISAAALAYAHEAVNTEFRFVKQSANWLRERRYEDKYAAPAAKAESSRPLPPWCGECADGNRAAERNGHIRQIYDHRGNAHPCPKCHPTQAAHAA